MKSLFLHTCCGPCFLGVWEDIQNKFEITNFFYNPNIQPKEESQKRLENLKIAARSKTRDVIEADYDPNEHKKAIVGLKKEFPKRCLNCYRLRLEKTAQTAKDKGFKLFSTTLLVSPYQQHNDLKNIGEEVAKRHNIEFYYTDWRSYFREGQNKAREMAIYRQKYCGCVWSQKEAEKQ